MFLSDVPHRRYNPLTGEYVLVSPHRAKRPWQGQVENLPQSAGMDHDPTCYLCPGNTRVNGEKNPAYQDTFSFVNDFSALYENNHNEAVNKKGLLVAETESGLCKVVCFSPRHDLTLAGMERADIVKVIDTWVGELKEFSRKKELRYIQIFENRGEMMGCSNPHPHGQIWATKNVPVLPQKEGENQKAWLKEKGKCLLCETVELELQEKERIVCENAHFMTIVPFWAVWPFETMILPKKHHASLLTLGAEEKEAFADILGRTVRRYDRLFNVSFPYSMGIHQEPCNDGDHPEWHFHLHFDPPLLRSATIKKFMVGYELMAQAQRDITPEQAAQRLRDCSEEPLDIFRKK